MDYEGACSVEIRSNATDGQRDRRRQEPAARRRAASRVALGRDAAARRVGVPHLRLGDAPRGPGGGSAKRRPDLRRLRTRVRREPADEPAPRRDVGLRHDDPRPALPVERAASDEGRAGRRLQAAGAGGPDRPGQRYAAFFEDGPPERVLLGHVQWLSSATDPSDVQAGSVVALSTVIDNRTQDTSLRVGISTRSLNPVLQPAARAAPAGREALVRAAALSTAARRPSSSRPFIGRCAARERRSRSGGRA